jgi:hypothetical protein
MLRVLNRQRLVTLLLGCFLAAQIMLWFQENAGSFRRVFLVLGQPAVWRGANFGQSQKFADYVAFLNEHIPLDYRVVLPPQFAGPKVLGTTPIMQYFLAPRQVINCGSAACIEQLSVEKTAVLIVGEFPGQAAWKRWPARSMFDGGWGVLLPGQEGGGTPLPRPASLISLLLGATPALAWLFALSAAGWSIIRWLMPEIGPADGLALGYGIGFAGLTLGMAILSLLGIPLRPETVLGLTALLLVLGAGGQVYHWRGSPRSLPDLPGSAPLSSAPLSSTPLSVEPSSPRRNRLDPWLLVMMILGVSAAFLGVGRAYHASDELLIWGTKGIGIAIDQSIANVMAWGTNTVHYPLHIPLLIAAFKLLFNETLPASKLAFAGYYIAMLTLVFNFLQRRGVSRLNAGLLSLCLGTTPILFRHATLAYANLPLAYALLAANLILEDGISKPVVPRRWLAVGCFLAWAAWTRPEGLAMAWGTIALLVVLCSFQKRRYELNKLAAVSAPLFIYILFWGPVLRSAYSIPAGKDGVVELAFQQILAGNLHLGDAAYAMSILVTALAIPNVWGSLGLILLIMLLAAVARFSRGNLLLAAGALYTLLVAGVYYLATFDSIHDIEWWLSTGLDRMLFPAVLLLFLGAGAASQLFHNRKDSLAPVDMEDDRSARIQG